VPIVATGRIVRWNGEKGSWHFLPVTGAAAVEVRLESSGRRAGFGSVRVEAEVNGVSWRTSLFPDRASGGYLLPLKAMVRRQAGLEADQTVGVSLELLS
jgi:hypothetical protein